MQVFKLYFKLLYKSSLSVIIYVMIFTAIVGFVLPVNQNTKTQAFSDYKCKYALFDYDNSEESEALAGYLSKEHEYTEIANDEADTIQDELYNRNVLAVVKIKKGYGKKFDTETISQYLEIYAIPQTVYANLVENDINSYVSTLKVYIAAGYSCDEAIERVNSHDAVGINVSYPDGEYVNERKLIDYEFTYLGWVLIAMLITLITPVLIKLNEKSVRARIECSAYRFSRLNKEMLLGVSVTGIAFAVYFTLLAYVMCKDELVTGNGFLLVCNMLCMIITAMSMAFLVSKLTDNCQAITMISNVVSLGMSFLCGVFVPMELLGTFVTRIAHFLPVYWYVKLIDETRQAGGLKTDRAFMYMAIQLMFAAVIVIAALVISKNKRQAAEE